MHKGAIAGSRNLIDILINNGVHETVGGMLAAAGVIDLSALLKVCGYSRAVSVDTYEKLGRELEAAKNEGRS